MTTHPDSRRNESASREVIVSIPARSMPRRSGAREREFQIATVPEGLRTQYSMPASTSGLRPHAKVVSYQPVIGVSVVPNLDECTIQSFPT